MLESHLSKLQDMLAQKSDLNSELDLQNKSYLEDIGTLKRTIVELNNSKSALSREHQYEIDNL